jgi:hypothetical protein
MTIPFEPYPVPQQLRLGRLNLLGVFVSEAQGQLTESTTWMFLGDWRKVTHVQADDQKPIPLERFMRVQSEKYTEVAFGEVRL